MRKRQKAERKVALTAQDMMFYVIYTLSKGFGCMTNAHMKNACSLKKDMIVKGTRIVLTEDYKAIESESGMRAQKRCAQLTLSGLRDFLDAMCFEETCDTMGSVTEYGVLPAISFSSFSTPDYVNPEAYERFCEKYESSDKVSSYQFDMMNAYYGCTEEMAYVSPLIDDSTLDEIYRGVYDEDTEANREDFKKRCEHYLRPVYAKWMDILEGLDEEYNLRTLDTSFMEIDFSRPVSKVEED